MFRYIKNNNLYLIYMEGLIETKNEYIEHMHDIIGTNQNNAVRVNAGHWYVIITVN